MAPVMSLKGGRGRVFPSHLRHACTARAPDRRARASAPRSGARRDRDAGGRSQKCRAQHQGIRGGAGEATGFTPELKDAVDRLIAENKVVLFMKGTKMFPQCGFSNTCVMIFNQLGVPFEDVNVLEDERIRLGMKEYSQWPTFPQVYLDGEFFGGCDILLESYHSGELQETLEHLLAS